LKYFLYAFIPSALLLVAMVWIYAKTGTFELPRIMAMAAAHQIPGTTTAMWLASLAFLLAFAVKVPVFPLHGWLSDAISEAPTAAVMVLAGKLGLYSIVRFSFGIFPEQSHRIAPLMIALGAIGIVYGACIALVQNDLKKLAAYSTLGHLSFITLGLFTLVINALMVLATGRLSESWNLGFTVSGFWAAFFGGLVVGLVSTILSLVLAPKASRVASHESRGDRPNHF